MNTCVGAPLFMISVLDLGEWSLSPPGRFYSWGGGGEEKPHQIDRRLDVPQSRSGRHGIEKNLLPLTEIEPRSSSQ
jgi:hypothetical protein